MLKVPGVRFKMMLSRRPDLAVILNSSEVSFIKQFLYLQFKITLKFGLLDRNHPEAVFTIAKKDKNNYFFIHPKALRALDHESKSGVRLNGPTDPYPSKNQDQTADVVYEYVRPRR